MPQFARPSADTVRTAWTDQAGGTTTIYTTIYEVSASDADYIKTSAPPGANEFETLLTLPWLARLMGRYSPEHLGKASFGSALGHQGGYGYIMA